MTNSRPNLRRVNYARNCENRITLVLKIAIGLLAGEEGLPRSEDPINRLLYFHILDAIRIVGDQGIEFLPYPMYEANNQPDLDDEQRATREHKRPDFQFGYINHYEEDPKRSAKQFVVECKRLGDSGSASWPLNSNYVGNGMCRFRDATHGYGKSCQFGAMVGYVQNMELDTILDEVNAAADELNFDQLANLENIGEPGLQQYSQQIRRSFLPEPYSLLHLWIDLRQFY